MNLMIASMASLPIMNSSAARVRNLMGLGAPFGLGHLTLARIARRLGFQGTTTSEGRSGLAGT